MIYKKQIYNSTFGSLILIKKILDPTTAVWDETKHWEKQYNKNGNSALEMLKKEILTLKPDAFQLFQYNTIRGPIFRLAINGQILPLREDLIPDPSFITHAEKEEIC